MLIGNSLERILADAGYRRHIALPGYRYTAVQKLRVTPQIKRGMRRRAAIETVIGHLKRRPRAAITWRTPPATASTAFSPPPAVTLAS